MISSTRDFLDSNVFVYLFDRQNERKRGIAESLVADALRLRSGRINHQVVQETLNVITSKIADALTAAEAADFLDRVLLRLWDVMPTPNLYRRGLEIQDRYGFSFYDALIVAAALEAGCTRLYSEDLQRDQRIEGLTIENPFLITDPPA